MDSEHPVPFGSFDDGDLNAVSTDPSHSSLDETSHGDAADLTFGSGGFQVNAPHIPALPALLSSGNLEAIAHRLGDLCDEVQIPVTDSSGVRLETLDDYMSQGGKE